MRKYRLLYPLSLFIFLLAVQSCSVKKNTWMSRNFHAVTTHYNIFFNGNESFKAGLLKIKRSFKDDYTRNLPVFTWSDDNIAKSITGDMDRTIKKASKIIALHSIKTKPELKKGLITEKEKAFYDRNEFNRWIDDTYLLMGKAYFYKHDYKLALETFRFVSKQYDYEITHYEALIWVARTNIEIREYAEARRVLEDIENDKSFPEKYQADLSSTWAHLFVVTENFKKAQPKLEEALAREKKKENRLRWTYLLAQLSSLNGDPAKASEYYSAVIRMNPPYEMVFNARISLAANYAEGSDAEAIRKELMKLLKDEKNKEYRDQVYYALGNLSQKEKQEADAIRYYQKSAATSTNNNRQKAISYIAIADLYFNRPDYIQAAAYYDSAVGFVDEKSFKNYKQITARASYLSKLAENVKIVQFEDSMLVLSRMEMKDLLVVIDNAIAEVNRKEQEERQRQAEKMLAEQIDAGFDQGPGLQDPTVAGKWYFYNSTIRVQGETEFKRKWGNRKLEDNWRRKNKNVVLSSEPTAGEGEEGKATEEKTKKVYSNKSREFYLQNIPFTDSMKLAAGMRTEKALYNAGLIYKDNLKEPELAAKSFNDLIIRFPDREYELPACFALYQIYSDQNNTAQANLIKNRIISKYPDSYFAHILLDPDYFKQLEEEQKKPVRFYEATYARFLAGDFSTVLVDADTGITRYPKAGLTARFLYLKALSFAKMGNKDTLRSLLNTIISKYPKEEVAASASNIIAYMDNKFPETKIKEDEKIATEIYSFMPEEKHLFAVVISSRSNMNQLVFNLINFNLDNFEKLNLNVEGALFGKSESMVTVKTFTGMTDAMRYASKIEEFKDIAKDVNSPTVNQFVISESNLATLKKDQVLERYLRYYEKNYLKMETP
ncbi:MAG: tetratricopeptide repeat protein [Bacteroidales bacterium]